MAISVFCRNSGELTALLFFHIFSTTFMASKNWKSEHSTSTQKLELPHITNTKDNGQFNLDGIFGKLWLI